MPEGDTVKRTAGRLQRALAGQPLLVAEVRWGTLAAGGLAGATTTEVVSRGKHLLHRVDRGLTVHSHLRMEGQWRIEAAGSPDAARVGRRLDVRAVVGTGTWTAYGLRLGMLDIVRTRDEDALVGHLGPDVLGPDWDADLARDRVLASGASIGAALLDQTNLAGVGTMWAAETLFVERLPPWSPATPDAVAAVLARVHQLMSAAVGHALQTSTGIRRDGENTYVHARSGRPCRRCGDGIRVAPIGPAGRERTMFYCPTCQGGLAPTDTGGPQAPLGSGRASGRRRRPG